MLIFRHKPSGLKIGCSFKVLYSFFVFHADKFEFLTEAYNADHGHIVDFFLVRNPFERCKSVFIDKLRVGVDKSTPQICQKMLLHYFGLSDPLELRQISFESFCLNVPFFYKQDAHFYPQECGYVPEKVKKIIRIESDLPWLEKQIGVDFSVRDHPSPRWLKEELQYSDSSAIAIQTLYAYDLKLFEYPRFFLRR